MVSQDQIVSRRQFTNIVHLSYFSAFYTQKDTSILSKYYIQMP